jgi:peptidoglycan L-alanyl-D-glutamate endopeptidase CwlK
MKKKPITYCWLFCSFLLFIFLPFAVESQAGNNIPVGLQRLLTAYPDHLVNAGEHNRLIWKDGTRMTFDDGITPKDFETLLNEPDLEDMLHMEYPPGKNVVFQKDFDPGRIRVETFFKKMYGSNPREVEKKLVPVRWLPKTVNKILLVTSVNGVDKKLQEISAQLEKKPHLHKYIDSPAGTYKWRKISGTERLSPHCFGIAIDINAKPYADYWQWNHTGEKNKNLEYQNRVPWEIVEIFEKHGFIWGGKWYHYDTMHFEYRPELLIRR